MKENEVLDNSIEINAGASLGESFAGFPKAAWTASNRYRGYSLERLVETFYSSQTGQEMSGKELTSKIDDFSYANRLKDLTKEAFKNINSDNIWNMIKINDKTADELWGDKYAHVEDKAQKELMYQIELLHQVFGGTSVITADVPGSEPVTILPEGSREALRNEIIREQSRVQRESAPEEVPEDEPVFEEQEIAPEEPAAEALKTDSLTEEALDTFNAEAYQRLWRTDPSIYITVSPVEMLSVLFNGATKAEEIVERYNKFGMKDKLDIAAAEFMKEVDGPERSAFLKEAGIDPAGSFTVDGQTLEERYGEKYKAIEDAELKAKLYKFELMNEISAAHLAGKNARVPEINIKTYELKDGSYVESGSRNITVSRPARKAVVEEEGKAVQAEEKKAEEKAELTPEQLKLEIIKAEDKVIASEKEYPANAELSESTKAKWETVKTVYSFHKEFKEALDRLNAVKKNALQGGDTTLYKNMKNALEDCVKLSDPENPMSTPKRLLEAMETYRKEADVYHKGRKGLIFGPGSEAGRVRLREAKYAQTDLPKKMDELKSIVDKIGISSYNRAHMKFLVEEAQKDARDLGINSFKVSEFEGKFDIEYIEEAAKAYLKEKKRKVTKESVADLSLETDFINTVERYPVSYDKVYDRFMAAKGYVKTHYFEKSQDKSLDKETRYNMSEKGTSGVTDIAWNLAHNPEFIEMYKTFPDKIAEKWEAHVKAEAYLTQKNGAKPSAEEVKELQENKVFLLVADKNPSDYAKAWDDNKVKAAEMKEQYKKELDDMIYGLEEYEGGILGYVKDAYDPDEKPNPEYEKAIKNLKSVKKNLKEERERIYEERQNLEEIADPEQRKQKQEQIEKDADALEKSTKAYKNKRNDIVREHLLPEFLTRVAFLKATQDPKIGENVCRLMATDAPQQELDVCGTILHNIKKPQNKEILKSKELTQMVMDGRIVGYVVPGAKRPEPEKKPEMNRRQTVHKAAQKAPGLK